MLTREDLPDSPRPCRGHKHGRQKAAHRVQLALVEAFRSRHHLVDQRSEEGPPEPPGLVLDLQQYAPPVGGVPPPALGRRRRVYAVDLMGDAGRTERRGTPFRTPVT